MLAPWKKSYDKLSILKSRDITLPTRVHLVKPMVFPVVMYGCERDHKEGWMPKNWCFQTVVPQKTLESPLDSKEIKPGNPKGNQLWIFIGRNDAEVPILLPPDVKSLLVGKYPDTGKDWGQEKRVTENEMVGCYHWLHRHEFEQALGVGVDRAAWCSAVLGVSKSQTQLSN